MSLKPEFGKFVASKEHLDRNTALAGPFDGIHGSLKFRIVRLDGRTAEFDESILVQLLCEAEPSANPRRSDFVVRCRGEVLQEKISQLRSFRHATNVSVAHCE